MNDVQIREFFTRLCSGNPEPRSELEFTNPYTLLVAVVLSAQATDKGVNRATRPLFAAIDTPQGMLEWGEERLRKSIQTIGLYKAKAKNIIGLSEALIHTHGGQVPCTREALMRLPGVGRKTANVVLNVAFGAPVVAVDTHVFRVCNRSGLARAPTPEKVEAQLEVRVPPEFRLHAHHWLILHGRYVCTARKPKCPQCPVRDLCEWEYKSVG